MTDLHIKKRFKGFDTFLGRQSLFYILSFTIFCFSAAAAAAAATAVICICATAVVTAAAAVV